MKRIYSKKRKKSPELGYRTSDDLKMLSARTITQDVKEMEKELNKFSTLFEEAKSVRELVDKVTRDKQLAIDTTVKPLRKQINEIKNSERNYVRRLLGIGKKELTVEAAQRIEVLEREIWNKLSEIDRQYPWPENSKGISSHDYDYYKDKVLFLEKAIRRYHEYLTPKMNKANKVAKWKAIAARENGKSREAAIAIKKQIALYEFCPYCGKTLGEQPHADHIYPISKGGLSVESNMIYICQKCNLKKRDMTLNAFIRHYELDREKIERTLSKLKKDF